MENNMNPLNALKKMADYALMVLDEEMEVAGLMRTRPVVRMLELLYVIDEEAFWTLWRAMEDANIDYQGDYWTIQKLLGGKARWVTEKLWDHWATNEQSVDEMVGGEVENLQEAIELTWAIELSRAVEENNLEEVERLKNERPY
jgi:hypothetical protein